MKGVLGVALTFVLVASLCAFAAPVAADPDENEWSAFKYPEEGADGDWFYDSGITYVGPIAMAINGDLYCAANADGANNLFKSDDGGRTWSKTDYQKDVAGGKIVDIACSSEDADIVYVADANYVYWTEDGGDKWTAVAPDSLDAAFANAVPVIDTPQITALDVGYIDDEPYVFISVIDSVMAYGGSVFFIEQRAYLAGWTDMDTQAYGTYDVYAVNVAPDFDDSHKIYAVITDATPQTLVITNTGTEGAWSQFGGDLETATSGGTGLLIVAASDVCFPDDFDDDELYVGVSGATVAGSVYRIVKDIAWSYRLGDAIYDTDISLDVLSLDITGDVGATLLLAGAQDTGTAMVLSSTDDGESWAKPHKIPSGVDTTYVLMAEDFADSGEAWAATAGDEGAVSYTIDGGDLFNQISLIATDIAEIYDVSFYPDYEVSEELFMVTGNTTRSLWRYDGEYWERVAVSNVFTPAADIEGVMVSPEILSDGTVYFSDYGVSPPTIYRSTDEGQSWKSLRCEPACTLRSAVVLDADTGLVGGVGVVYKTDDHGNRVWKETLKGEIDGEIRDFALFGETVLCGSTTGKVAISEDLGDTWDQVGKTGDLVDGTQTFVAFDTDYADNSYVYAACGDDIYRFEVGESTHWKDIDDDKAAGGLLSDIVTADGCVYVSDAGTAGAGMWRSVNPTAKTPLFEKVDFELVGTELLWGLKTTSGSNVLWALDWANPEVLWTYEDALVGPVELDSPASGTALGRMTSATLTWDELADADDYDLKVYTDEDFSKAYMIYDEPTDSDDGLYRLTNLPAGAEFFWKVRVSPGDPLASKWSTAWSFATAMGGAEWNPFDGPVSEYPYPGASNIPISPTFAWNAADWATGYEFVLADNSAFTDPMVEETVTTTVYVYGADLSYSATYYWKVRAVSATSASNWATGVFTTAAAPVEVVPPPPPVEIPPLPAPISPAWIWAVVIIGAVLVIAVIVLIVTTRRVP